MRAAPVWSGSELVSELLVTEPAQALASLNVVWTDDMPLHLVALCVDADLF